jgi:hypothetical protein
MFLDGLQKCAGASSPRRFGVSKKAPAEPGLLAESSCRPYETYFSGYAMKPVLTPGLNPALS